MASPLAEAHITAEARLRRAVVGALEQIWRSLPGYDRPNVDEWLSRSVPVVLTGQRTSIALTEAYLASFLDRTPLGVDADAIIASARAGADPAEVYRRPFVTLWTALGNGSRFEDASSAALARATATAAMDMQLAMRGTASAVQSADDGIYGYERVADGDACDFCSAIDGAYVKDADAYPLHDRCGCGLVPLTEPHPRAAFLPSGESVREHYAIREHGEVGPLLVDPADHFTHL